MNMLRKIVYNSATKRAVDLYNSLNELLPKHGTLLDYGCGIGFFGHEVEKRTSSKLTYLDVKSYPFMNPDIKLECYDGNRIPFADSSYDNCMAVFTLHHTRDAYESLSELARVTRGDILVCEDFIASPIHKYIEVVKDLISNCFMAQITMQYRQDHEWEDMFSDLNLTIKRKKHFSSFFFPIKYKHVVWLLSK